MRDGGGEEQLSHGEWFLGHMQSILVAGITALVQDERVVKRRAVCCTECTNRGGTWRYARMQQYRKHVIEQMYVY